MKVSDFLFRRGYSCALLAIVILFLWSYTATGKSASEPGHLQESEDKTLSPYFFVKSDNSEIDQLPLKSTSTVVNVSGIIADVTVSQVYKNEGRKPIEALYIFPASTRSAVYGMKMTIGERTLTAQIQKRDDARQAYERAWREGKSASLLEQQRPNVFQMNVANIMPGDEIKTELRYTELLAPTEGVYEFVYPTVVGPRYSNRPTSGEPLPEKWIQNPYLHEGEPPASSFNIRVKLVAGVPIEEAICTSHKASITYEGKTIANIELDPSEGSAGNRDFILKYRLAGERIESGLLLFEGEKENFFLLMMQPPKRITEASVPPREFIFIMDVSGSMNGYPIDISKKLFKDLTSGLRQTDTFNVLLFSGGSELFSERSLPANQDNIKRAISLIDSQQGGGGTELLPALVRALALPRTEGMSRTFVIATDGYIEVEPEILDVMRKSMGSANFFPFGIGTSVNRYLIEGMAHVGAGEPIIITDPAEAPGKAERFRKYIQNPLLTRASLDFGKFEAYDVEPSGVPDLFAERPIVVFGKWRGKPQGTITVSGLSGKQEYRKTIEVSRTAPLPENSALRYLWARSRVLQLSDYNRFNTTDERVRQITELGLSYNLLTAYTSFVAIDREVRRSGEEMKTVVQPLPLPDGVSDYAIGDITGGGNVASSSTSPPLATPYAPSYPIHAAKMPRLREKAMAFDSAGSGGGTLTGNGSGAGTPAFQATMPSSEDAPGETSLSRIVIEKLVVEGDPSEEAVVRQYVEENLDRVRKCVEPNGQNTLPAKLNIKWTIHPDGTLGDIQLAQGGDQETLTCLSKEMAAWVFPVVKNGKEVRVVVTISITN